MKLALASHEQRTVLFVGLLGIVVLWVYSAFVLGFMREASTLAEQVTTARRQVTLFEAALANEASIREQYQQLDQTVSAMRKVLPSEDEVPAVIETLSQLAGQSQVKILTIFPQRSADDLPPNKGAPPASTEPAVTKLVMIQIDALGGYHELGTLLSLIESGDKPMQVASLRISSDPKDLKRQHIKLVIRALFAVSPSAVPSTPATPGRSS